MALASVAESDAKAVVEKSAMVMKLTAKAAEDPDSVDAAALNKALKEFDDAGARAVQSLMKLKAGPKHFKDMFVKEEEDEDDKDDDDDSPEEKVEALLEKVRRAMPDYREKIPAGKFGEPDLKLFSEYASQEYLKRKAAIAKRGKLDRDSNGYVSKLFAPVRENCPDRCSGRYGINSGRPFQ